MSDVGQRQAAALVVRLADVPLQAIYSSPLERTRETAEPLATARRLEVKLDPGLLEVDYGDWTGRPIKELRRASLWQRVQRHPSEARFPGGEAVAEAEARVVGAIEGIFRAHAKELIAAFSHADIIKLAVAHFLGLPLDRFQGLSVSPASVTAVYLGAGFPRLLRLNDVGTLADLRPPKRRGRAAATKPQN